MSNNYLSHHGILGQKWGVIRSQEQLRAARGVVNSSKEIVDSSRNITSSVSNKDKITVNKELKKKMTEMTDKELRDRVNRLNMEQQYSRLVANDISEGREYVKSNLEIAGNALAITSSALGIALAIKTLKENRK